MKRNALIVGAFLIGALVLGILGIALLSGGNPFVRTQRAVAYFDGAVTGLYVGAPVTFRGVRVGQVARIDIEVDSRTLEAVIPVELTLVGKAVHYTNGEKGDSVSVDQLVQRGLRARLVQQSLVTGQSLIDLDFLPETPVVKEASASAPSDLPEIPVVKGRIEAIVEQLSQLPIKDTVEQVQDTMKQLNTTLASANTLFKTLNENVGSLTSDARTTLAQTNKTIVEVEKTAQTALVSITRLTDTSEKAISQASPELQRTLIAARESAEAAELAMRRITEISAPGAPLREDLQSSLRDLALAARSLRRFSETIENDPNAIIFGKESQ
ncbi:MlaD family protein [soil metagenome]